MTESEKSIDQKKKAVAKTVKEGLNSAGEKIGVARERLSEVADGVGDKVRQIRTGAGKASEQIRTGAGQVSEKAKQTYEVASNQLRAGYGKTKKDVDQLLEDVNIYVRDNPAKSVVIAAGAGFFLGLLVRGSRRD